LTPTKLRFSSVHERTWHVAKISCKRRLSSMNEKTTRGKYLAAFTWRLTNQNPLSLF
jgi:hypothetical protein